MYRLNTHTDIGELSGAEMTCGALECFARFAHAAQTHPTMSLKRFYLRYYPPGLGLCTVDGPGGAEHVQMIDLLDFDAG